MAGRRTLPESFISGSPLKAGAFPLAVIVVSHASGRIRCPRKAVQKGKKRRRLTDEQPVRGKGVERGHCSSACLGRTNDRADREPTTKEDCRLGHDQVGLGQFAVGVEVREDQAVRGIGQGRRIAGFILPGLEVHNLSAADAEQDSQHVIVGDPLGERRVQAGATLLDPREVEAGRVGDRL